ncbi:MAG: GNAT family N-acetyltransferase [Planctomycetaceae bacterium]|nr:GNAT family N-acetyltransferase [Planctomycetaceae bacterium]
MTDNRVEIRALVPGDDEQRDSFVDQHVRGTVFHTARWRRAVERVFGHPPRELGAFQDGRMVGMLPLMRTPSVFGPHNHVSVPYATYGGALGESEAIEIALVQRAIERARTEGVGRMELRCLSHAPNLPGLVASDLYWTFQKQLPKQPEEVLLGMPKKARAEARKARERHGLRLVEGNWYLDDLYRLFLRNKRALGSPALPAAFFSTLREELGARAVVHLVVRGREPLAAVMSFVHGSNLVAYYSGSAPDVDRDYSASNFMYMALQEWCVREGFEVFDFCRSRGDSGAFRFKEHQGFVPQPLPYRYALLRAKGLPSFTPSNPRTRGLREAWTKLPLVAVERLSPLLSRYLA